MLFKIGFEFTVTRKVTERHIPATIDDERGQLVVRWQTGPTLQWINDLCATGEAQSLGGDGYPYWYTLHFSHLDNIFRGGPPPESKHRLSTNSWSKFVPSEDLRSDVVSDLTDDEWFLVTVFDTS